MSVVAVRKEADGVIAVLYRGEPVGWISPIRTHRGEGRRFRALSVHGAVAACGSLKSARCFLLGAYH